MLITTYIKELFRPTRLLRIIRHYENVRKFKKSKAIIGFDVVVKNTKLEGKNAILSGSLLSESVVGYRSVIGKNCQISNCIIGRFCAIAEGTRISIGKHPIDMVSTYTSFYSNNKITETFTDGMYYDEYPKKTIIGNDVWIGINTIIGGGTKIGDGAIIAYGSNVYKPIPPYAIVRGIPAEVIGYRFSEEIISKLLEIKWWNLSDEFHKKHFKLYHDPNKFIEFYDTNKVYVESFRLNL